MAKMPMWRNKLGCSDRTKRWCSFNRSERPVTLPSSEYYRRAVDYQPVSVSKSRLPTEGDRFQTQNLSNTRSSVYDNCISGRSPAHQTCRSRDLRLNLIARFRLTYEKKVLKLFGAHSNSSLERTARVNVGSFS